MANLNIRGTCNGRRIQTGGNSSDEGSNVIVAKLNNSDFLNKSLSLDDYDIASTAMNKGKNEFKPVFLIDAQGKCLYCPGFTDPSSNVNCYGVNSTNDPCIFILNFRVRSVTIKQLAFES